MKTFTVRAVPSSPVARPMPTSRGTVRQFFGVLVIVALVAAGWFGCAVVQRVSGRAS